MRTRQSVSMNSFSLTRFVALMRTPLYRDAYALILSAGTTSGLGIAYWVLAARYYPISALGSNAAAIASMMFLSGVAQLNLMGAMIRFIPAAGRAARRLIGSAYLISSLLAVVVGLIFILGLDVWSPKLGFLRADLQSSVWFILAIVAWGIFALQDNVLTGLRQARWVPIENSVFGIVKITLLILFAKPFPQYGIFASWTICVVAAVVPVNLLIFKRLLPVHIRRTARQATPLVPAQIVRYVAGDYVGSLFSLASTTLLPLMVTQLAGTRANAYFYLAWIIAYSLQLVSMYMTISLTVEASTDAR